MCKMLKCGLGQNVCALSEKYQSHSQLPKISLRKKQTNKYINFINLLLYCLCLVELTHWLTLMMRLPG